MLYNLLYNMQRLAILFMLAASSAFAVPQPYPIAVDSQTRSVPALEMYQAEPFTVRVTFKSGGTNENVSGAVPFMWWALSAQATNYVTSSWVRVDGGTGGVVDFAFSASALNTNGDVVYGVGANQTFRQGALRIRANPWTVGVASPTFTLSTNLSGWSFVNYPWLDSASVIEGNSNHVAVLGNALQITVRTNFGGGTLASESDPIWSAASNSYLTTAAAQSRYATGSPIYSLTGYATGTPIYAESDPLFVAASNALLTKAQASALYATGTPVYAVSGLGTDTTARAWAVGASNRADAAYVLAANAATGTPIYSVAGLATGTPIYSVAGLATGTPIYSVAGLATGTPIYSVAGLATGTPLYAENNPDLSPLSNGVANAQTVGSNALATANAASNLAAGAAGWGNHATNKYAVQGGNITGTWYAAGNTNLGLSSFVGGGSGNLLNGFFGVIAGGKDNEVLNYGTTVSGGDGNVASDDGATVGGGIDNGAYGLNSLVSGGSYNSAMLQGSTVGGGLENVASGFVATVSGGYRNRSSGDYSATIGGYNNTAVSASLAAGMGAKATNYGSFVWSSSGTTNATFGSSGDNTFNVRSVGGVYFLAPDFWIQDTNGNTIARFSATNTTISGNLNLTGYATTSDVLTVGIRATNAQITASNAATTASAATNLALAIGAGATNGLLAVGLVATNAQVTASNALSTAQAAQVQASNINAGAWSQIATGAVSMATNRINQISAISFVNNATIGDIDYGLLFTNGYPAYAQGSSRYSFYGTWNFSPSSYQTAAAQASYATNAIKLFAGIVTQNQITARNQAFFDGTNIWIGLGGTNSLRMGGVLNAY